MESSGGVTEISSQKDSIVFEKKAPKLVEVSVGNIVRENMVKSNNFDKVTYKPIERTFAEKEGIDDLVDFLDLGTQTAMENGDLKTVEKIQLFKENIAFVGEPELKTATQGIASHLIELAQTGKDVFINPANNRSERYISLRIMEELDYLTEENPELRNRFKISQNEFEIARHAKEVVGNCRIIIPDDFVVSGTRIKGFAGKMINILVELGFSPEKAMEMVEADVVAIPQRPNEKGLEYADPTNGKQKYLNTYSFYSVPEYRNSDDRWVVYPGISMTGTHSSTDYGFETVLESIQKYLGSRGIEKDLPLLTNIKRPYEMMDGGSTKYKDEELQKRWNKIQEKYGLETKKN